MGGYKIQFAFLHCKHTLYSTWSVQCKLFWVELSAIELTANVKKLQPAHSERCSAVQSLHIRVECTQFSDFTTLTCGCYPSNPTPLLYHALLCWKGILDLRALMLEKCNVGWSRCKDCPFDPRKQECLGIYGNWRISVFIFGKMK